MRAREILRRHFLIRRYEAADLLESFMVSAVTALLLIRFILKLTGYPQIGNEQLHIAHLLWGGLFMLAAIVILLVWMSRLPLHLASVVGGIGFGMFIDELGKFITSDNDYFYEPTIALIYVTFILLLLLFRTLGRYAHPTAQMDLINSLELTKEAVIKDLDTEEKAQALRLLSRCDPEDPVVRALRGLLEAAVPVPATLPRPVARVRTLLDRLRREALITPWFTHTLNWVVIACVSAALIEGIQGVRPEWRHISTAAWGQLFSSILIALLVAAGFLCMSRSRLTALRLFNRGALISIFVTQVFAFYREQLKAIVGLGISIVLWLVLRAALREEKRGGVV
jgi:hypothetical protein